MLKISKLITNKPVATNQKNSKDEPSVSVHRLRSGNADANSFSNILPKKTNIANHSYSSKISSRQIMQSSAESAQRIRLDEKDKIILVVLNRDASLSFTDIEKETKIPRHVVANRIRKLEKGKIIKAYKLDINYRLLGWEEFEVHLRLMGVDDNKMLEIISDIQKNHHVSWIGTCFGNYDIKINVFAKNNSECYSIVNECLKKHREYVHAEEITSITLKLKTDGNVFLRSLLDMNELHIEAGKRRERTENSAAHSLDDTDKIIIRDMGKNARVRLTELSKAAGLTIQGTKNRIDSLYSRKIILGSTTLIHGPSLGKIWGTCLFKMNLNIEQEKALEKHLYSLRNTSSAVRLIGKWDLGITFFDRSVKALQAQINDFKGMFKDNIKEYDAFLILDIYKYPQLPECIFEK